MPWSLSAFWNNTLKLGSEMGEGFGLALLRAAGVTSKELDLKRKLGGDRNTVLVAIRCMATAGLKSLSLEANHLGHEDVSAAMSQILPHNASLTRLNVSRNNIQ